jgi:hypothetical protein
MDGVGEEKRLRGRGGKGSGGDCVLYALAFVFIYQGKTHTIPHPAPLAVVGIFRRFRFYQFYQEKTPPEPMENYGPIPAFDPR